MSMYYVYFDDDMDPTDWEAAIMYIVGGMDEARTSYYVSDLTKIVMPTGSREVMTGWTMDSDGGHHSVSGKKLTLSFPEYANVAMAKIMVATMQMEIVQRQMTGWYWDWVPDEYEFFVGWKEPTMVTTPVAPELQLEWALAATVLLTIPTVLFLRGKRH